jgi:hypothetical protein
MNQLVKVVREFYPLLELLENYNQKEYRDWFKNPTFIWRQSTPHEMSSLQG